MLGLSLPLRFVLPGLALFALVVHARADAPSERARASLGAPSLARVCEELADQGAHFSGAAPQLEGPRTPLSERLLDCVGEAQGDLPRTLSVQRVGTFLELRFERGRRQSWLARFLGLPAGGDRSRRLVPFTAEMRRLHAPRPPIDRSTVVARAIDLPGRGYRFVASAERLGGGVLVVDAQRIQRLRVHHVAGQPRLRSVEEQPWPRPAAGRPSVVVASPLAGGFELWQSDGHFWRLEGPGLSLSPANPPCDEGYGPLEDGCVRLALGRDYFDSRMVAREGVQAPPRAPTSFYRRFLSFVRRADGSQSELEVVVSPRGRVVARTGARTVGAAGYGAALGAGYDDGDGQVELLLSSDAALGSGDRLNLLRVRSGGALVRVWQSEPVAGSITQAGFGDIDEDGEPELFAIEDVEEGRALLWVVR